MMHTKLHDLVKPLLLALVLGLLSGCGGSGSDDSSTPPTNGTTTNGTTPNVTTPNVTTPVYSYDFPSDVARDSFPALSKLPSGLFPDLVAKVDRSAYTITYVNVSAEAANALSVALLNRDIFAYNNGYFTFNGKWPFQDKVLTQATALIAHGTNNLYTVTFGVIFDGGADIVGPGFFADLFDEVDAPVSTISTTYYYDQKTLTALGVTAKVGQVPPMYNEYKIRLTEEGYENNSLLNNLVLIRIPILTNLLITAVDPFINTFYKEDGNFRYEWTYTARLLGTLDSYTTWTVSRIGSI
jgi:hypothetical protein